MIYLILTIVVHDKILCRTLLSACRMFRYKAFLEKILRLSHSHVIIDMNILFFIFLDISIKAKYSSRRD
jgi:hypothetical protein